MNKHTLADSQIAAIVRAEEAGELNLPAADLVARVNAIGASRRFRVAFTGSNAVSRLPEVGFYEVDAAGTAEAVAKARRSIDQTTWVLVARDVAHNHRSSDLHLDCGCI